MIPGAEALSERISKNSKDLDALLELARSANRAGDYYFAKMVASKALEVDESSAVAHNAMAVAELQLGNYQAAYFAAQRALDADGRFAAARANLGAFYNLFGDKKRARASFKAAGRPSGPDVAAKAKVAMNSTGG